MTRPFVGRLFRDCLRSRPKVAAEECIGCGKCFETGPAKAIEMKNKLPHIHRGKCIRRFLAVLL